MVSSPTDGPDWEPHACAVATCGRQLQVQVAYCPFCGAAQVTIPAGSIVMHASNPGADVFLDSASSAPMVATATPRTQPDPPPVAQMSPDAPTFASSAPPLCPPVAVVARGHRWWPLVLVCLLAVAGTFSWVRSRGSVEPPASFDQCRVRTTEVRLAISAGDWAAAKSGIVQARSECSGEQGGAIDTMERQLEALKTQISACAVLKKKLLSSLNNGQPGEVSNRIAKAPRGCASQPAIRSVVDRSLRQMEQAAEAVNSGFGRVNAGDLDGADALLASALRIDARVKGADALRRSLVEARHATTPDLRSAPTVQSAVVTQPSIARTPEPPVLAPAPVASVFDDLIGDGQLALQRKNYTEAKSAAKSALRLAPGSRSAKALLREAEDGERDALQNMQIH